MVTATAPIEDLKVLVRPLGDRVLVTLDESSDRSPGGIVLPESAKEIPQEGIVMRVGKGRRIASSAGATREVDGDGTRWQPLDVKEGDRVYIGRYSGVDIKLGGTTLKLLREDDILAVMGE